MSVDRVTAIARAVLYEGYLLWPYRRSAMKNVHRFNFGGLFPPRCAERFAERAVLRFSALVEGAAPRFSAEIRFLHVVRRQVVRDGLPVEEAHCGDEGYFTWDEAAEDCTRIPGLELPSSTPIVRDAAAAEERVDASIVLRRTREPLTALFSVSATRRNGGPLRIEVELRNCDAWDGAAREDALRHSFAACHVVLRVANGAFVSPLDDPECAHEGLWPALAGERGERDTLLATPVILGDYPAVAPESPGDLFDGGEIDALLIHSLRALTDEEQREIRATDPRARELLDRSLHLDRDALLRLYGPAREERRLPT